MLAEVSEPRSRFANTPETLAARATRAELRHLSSQIVRHQLGTFRQKLGTQDGLHAVTLDDETRGSSDASTISDEQCWMIGIQWLLKIVARRVDPKAPVILKFSALDGLTWTAIGFRLRMDPMRARLIFYAATAILICDARFYRDLHRDEAA